MYISWSPRALTSPQKSFVLKNSVPMAYTEKFRFSVCAIVKIDVRLRSRVSSWTKIVLADFSLRHRQFVNNTRSRNKSAGISPVLDKILTLDFAENIKSSS